MSTDPVVLDAMRACMANTSDPEVAHRDADELLCEVLNDDGHSDLTDLWLEVRRWYA